MTTYDHPITPAIDCPPAERLRRVAYLIDRYDTNYDQSTWGSCGEGPALIDLDTAVRPFCGTAFCIAGWTLLDAGYKAVFEPNRNEVDRFVRGEDTINAIYTDIEQAAGAMLGLSIEDARDLFEPSWMPRPDISPHDALMALADGVSLRLVTDHHDGCDCIDCEDER